MKNGHVELVVQEYSPNPLLLKCGIKDTAGSTVTIAFLRNDKMQVLSDNLLQQYSGRLSRKENFTIVVANITFREQGFEFECDLIAQDFTLKQTVHKLELVLGK